MAIFQGLVFLFFGVGLLAIDGMSLSRGWLPCGPNWKGGLELHRQEQPVGYWLMFAVYAAAGAWLTGFALRLLAGYSHPLPLR
jgi:hypothetical protein